MVARSSGVLLRPLNSSKWFLFSILVFWVLSPSYAWLHMCPGDDPFVVVNILFSTFFERWSLIVCYCVYQASLPMGFWEFSCVCHPSPRKRWNYRYTKWVLGIQTNPQTCAATALPPQLSSQCKLCFMEKKVKPRVCETYPAPMQRVLSTA